MEVTNLNSLQIVDGTVLLDGLSISRRNFNGRGDNLAVF